MKTEKPFVSLRAIQKQTLARLSPWAVISRHLLQVQPKEFITWIVRDYNSCQEITGKEVPSKGNQIKGTDVKNLNL